MGDEENSESMSYADRFYSSRRAALSYAAILFIFSTATPVSSNSDVCKSNSTVKLTFVDVCINTNWVFMGLMVAVVFYGLAFYRAHITTDIMNKSAIANSGGNVTDAINNVAKNLGSLNASYIAADKSARLAIEGARQVFSAEANERAKIEGFIEEISPFLSSMVNNSLRDPDVKGESDLRMQRDRMRQLQGLERQIYLFVLREFQSRVDSVRAKLNDMSDHKVSAEKIIYDQSVVLGELNRKFATLHSKYHGSTARWFIFYDIFLVYAFLVMSLCMGLRKLDFTLIWCKMPWILISGSLLALALVVVWYKWSDWLRFSGLSEWNISFRWPISITRES